MFINEFILYGFLFIYVSLLVGLWREYRLLLRDIDQMQTKTFSSRNQLDKLELENEYLSNRNRFLAQQTSTSRNQFIDNEFDEEFNDELTRSTAVTHRDIAALAEEITSIRKILDSV